MYYYVTRAEYDYAKKRIQELNASNVVDILAYKDYKITIKMYEKQFFVGESS